MSLKLYNLKPQNTVFLTGHEFLRKKLHNKNCVKDDLYQCEETGVPFYCYFFSEDTQRKQKNSYPK